MYPETAQYVTTSSAFRHVPQRADCEIFHLSKCEPANNLVCSVCRLPSRSFKMHDTHKHFLPRQNLFISQVLKPDTCRWEGRTVSSPRPHKALLIIGPLCCLLASHRIQFMLYLCSLKRTLLLSSSITFSFSAYPSLPLSFFLSFSLSLPFLPLLVFCCVEPLPAPLGLPSADNNVPSRCFCPRYQLFLYGIIRHITDLNTAKPYSFVFT